MSKVISIIIPTYNMEAYLDKCLTSLIIDGMERVEVVVVNDGSRDSSLAIAQSYAEKYPESFVVIDKPNGNYGSCINAGLYRATGKYVKVLDADDSFYTENFAKMVSMLETLDVDLFLTDFVRIYADREKRATLNRFPAGVVMDFTKECLQDKKRLWSIWMHNIAYKRENLIRINYTQSEGIFYTDNEWKFKPMVTVKSAYYWDQPVYRYLLDREGQSVSLNVTAKHLVDDMVVTEKILKDYEEMVVMNPEMAKMYKYVVYRRVSWLYNTDLVKRGLLDNPQILEFNNRLKELNPKMYKKVGKNRLSKLLPIHYIKMWRKNPNGLLLKLLVKLAK